jgi:AbrB family looped-hinge helix DNA binding protein
MTTVLSQKGQLVLPASVRERLDLCPGDDFEIFIEDDDTILLRRVSSPPNAGLVELLLSAPGELDIPDRSLDTPVIPLIED